jgi:hypothetical protein
VTWLLNSICCPMLVCGVAIMATVRKRVTEDRVSVLIPSYDQPHYRRHDASSPTFILPFAIP